ncbi:WD repeat-containing protein jip5, partial [Massospora cicadina]
LLWTYEKKGCLHVLTILEDELLSVALVKDGKKAVVGTQNGVLNLFTWGDWGDLSDRFMGHPESVDAVVKFDEDTVVTGSSDGICVWLESFLTSC